MAIDGFPGIDLPGLRAAINAANQAQAGSAPPAEPRTLEQCDAEITALWGVIASLSKAIVELEGERARKK